MASTIEKFELQEKRLSAYTILLEKENIKAPIGIQGNANLGNQGQNDEVRVNKSTVNVFRRSQSRPEVSS